MNDDLFRYWTFARQKLRISDAEFWLLSPREFSALADRWSDDQKAEDRRAATVCMVLANCHRDKTVTPRAYTVGDFMPTTADAGPPKEQSWEEQVAIFGAVAEVAKATQT